jgi:hypothetical protein
MADLRRATLLAGAVGLIFGTVAMGCGPNVVDPPTSSGQAGGGGGAGGGGTAGAGATGGGGTGGAAVCQPGETQACYDGDPATQNVGECKGGAKACASGQWSETCEGQVLPAGAEACDGKDEDCNGQVDDAIAQITCGMGACQVSVDGCVDGAVPTCTPLPPAAAEACDGTDDNCDGQVDEGCTCVDGSTQACYTAGAQTKGVGECKDGTQTCAGGQWGACEGEVLPADEACDGKDNDCDGAADENMGEISCGAGACLKTVAACVNGAPQQCQPGTPTMEVCNGVDDDCDLLIDDSLGMTSCGMGACMVTVPACVGGKPSQCMPKQPTIEICDGIDNDCDGQADEGNPESGGVCTTGQQGVCSSGIFQCLGGKLVCTPAVPSSAETCDAKDNDCDGMVDDGNPGGGVACMTGKPGVCGTGATACTNGMIACNQTVQPSAEICDGKDNDCDNTIDEDNPGGGVACMTGKPGVCAAGTTACTAGKVACNQNTQPSAEICDGIDNDCDGMVDEGIAGGGSCDTGKPGVCGPGTMTCSGGAFVCTQTVQPTAEICDGKDNDCDGPIDEGLAANVTMFAETFANNNALWTLGTEWQIGPAKASTGHDYGNPDPALDHTPTADNGVAGVVIGGNAATTVHAAYYLTSPIINTGGVLGNLTLDYWRFLNSDYDPFMINTVEVYNGSAWVVVWQSGANPGVIDAAWTNVGYNLTAYKNASMRIRFGFTVGQSGAFIVSSWNIDDVVIRRCQ